ncbi:uncharacterized protein VTP21DRAFT_10007 [Calcarisporiella thermophila]|uniref:uncharacterized protein n=1 Tax=Calcarisporiella thermophila TaxID=911321 RepID=UPI003742B8EF
MGHNSSSLRGRDPASSQRSFTDVRGGEKRFDISNIRAHTSSPAAIADSSQSFVKDNQQALSTSNAHQFHYVDGRRFLNVRGIKYIMPSDEEEIDRLQMLHYIYRYLFQGNFSAPIREDLERGIKVLDAGCGPGSWTMEMATEFSRSSFVGVDIANSFPSTIVPSNCTFRIVNLVEPLPFEDEEFDYVCLRGMALAFTREQWPFVLAELTRVLKRDGYLEWTESDHEFKRRGPTLTKLNDQVLFSLRARDLSPSIARNLHKYLYQSKNMTNITKKYVSIPIGRWGGRCGELARSDFLSVMTALKPSLLMALGASNEEYDMMTEQSLQEFEEYKTYNNIYVVTAQKAPRDDKENNQN